jgi:excisionase family DNA binding protein
MPFLQKTQRSGPQVNDRQLKLPFDTITVKISVAVQITGIGRTKMYELINDGQIEVIKVGTATLIPVDSLRRFLDGLRQKPPRSSSGYRLDA